MSALLEHFQEAITEEADVEQLKKLILQLAFEGKLVEQNSNDEDVSVLVKMIEKEKEVFIKDKKIKLDKSVSIIKKEEQPFAIPSKWKWVRLGQISNNIHYGYTASSTKINTGVKLLRITDIQNNQVNWATVPFCAIEETSVYKYDLQQRDILIARTGGTIGKSFILDNVMENAVFASYLIRVIPSGEMNATYIKRFLESSFYWKQLTERSKGTGQPNVNATSLGTLVLPLPPRKEQDKIVKRINELFTFCDKLKSDLRQTEKASSIMNENVLSRIKDYNNPSQLEDLQFVIENMKHLCNSKKDIDLLGNCILSLSIQGKLVKQGKYDGSEIDLKQKALEKKDSIYANEKTKKIKNLKQISEEEFPFEIPQGWEWMRLGNLVSKLGAGKTPRGGERNYVNCGVKFIRSQNVWNSGLVTNGIAYITEETNNSMSGSLVHPQDILMNITGASIGRSSLIPDDFDLGNVNQHVAIIRLIDKNMRHFIHQCIISPYFQQEIMKMQVGVSREGLSMTKLGNFLVPIPPLEEQERIVLSTKRIFTLLDELEERILQQETKRQSLLRSYL